MKTIKNVLIFIICLTATNTTLAQSIKKFAPKVAENARIKDEISLDGDVENIELYENIPKDFVNFKSAYLYIYPVQGIYEKLMMETQQPERWEKFKKRFSVSNTIRIYDKKLLNNKSWRVLHVG